MDTTGLKERFLVHQLYDFIHSEDDPYRVGIIAGMRKTGKTTILHQLKNNYFRDAVYIDASKRGMNNTYDIENEFLQTGSNLLLIDEVHHIKDFDMMCQTLHDLAWKRDFKIIVAGSATTHMRLLNRKKLGTRSKLFRLQPLSFTEFLYFRGDIDSLSDHSDLTKEQFSDYLSFKGLNSPLALVFDEDYFRSWLDEEHTANKNAYQNDQYVDLYPEDISSMMQLFAYRLADRPGYRSTFTPEVGEKERAFLNNLECKVSSNPDLSNTDISLAVDHVADIPARTRARLMKFMVQSGLACVEVVKENPEHRPSIGYLEYELDEVRTNSDIGGILRKLSISLMEPHLYTRLGNDILQRFYPTVLPLTKGTITGQLLEIYLRGKIASYDKSAIPTMIKYNYPDFGEVDICSQAIRLFCEVTVSDKKGKRANIHKYDSMESYLRVCTSGERESLIEGVYHIPYPVFCNMVDLNMFEGKHEWFNRAKSFDADTIATI